MKSQTRTIRRRAAVLLSAFCFACVALAGNGKHGQHLAFDKTNNAPLPNLYVSMLQRLGLDAAKFASSTGTMRGLELV